MQFSKNHINFWKCLINFTKNTYKVELTNHIIKLFSFKINIIKNYRIQTNKLEMRNWIV